MNRTLGEKVFNVINLIFFCLFSVILLIPILYILQQSLDVGAVKSGLSLWPSDPSTAYYQMVLGDSGIYGPLLNSIYITIVGTVLSVLVNAAAAYPMSRKDYKPNKVLVYYIVIIPMLFSGGQIPTFLVLKELNMLNTLAVCFVPTLASGWNIVLIRNYYKR